MTRRANKKKRIKGYRDVATDQSNSVGTVEAKLFNVNDANSNKFCNEVADSSYRTAVRNNWKIGNGVYYFHNPDVSHGNFQQHLLKKLIAGRFYFNECHFMKWNLFVCDV